MECILEKNCVHIHSQLNNIS